LVPRFGSDASVPTTPGRYDAAWEPNTRVTVQAAPQRNPQRGQTVSSNRYPRPREPARNGEGSGITLCQRQQARYRSGSGTRGVWLSPSRRQQVSDEETLTRIRKLAIPPAYENVWICTDPNGHLLAVGRDARGRKQYRYHPRWREVRDEGKYGKMLLFGKQLPRIRAQVQKDLARHGIPREKVLAAIVCLLETTLMRVGNEEYAKTNKSYGLTTLRNRHVKIEGASRIYFDFRGKHGTEHHIDLRDKRLASIVRRCQELPGQELFQ
jgi:DNA topoisomerase-1